MIKRFLIILIVLTSSLLNKVIAQDSIRFVAKLDNFLIYESIELYPDSTFKWSSEYDLKWSEYGRYTVLDHILTLYFNDEAGNKIKTYMIIDDKMYLTDKSGKKISRLKDKSVKCKKHRLKFGYHAYCFNKEK